MKHGCTENKFFWTHHLAEEPGSLKMLQLILPPVVLDEESCIVTAGGTDWAGKRSKERRRESRVLKNNGKRKGV